MPGVLRERERDDVLVVHDELRGDRPNLELGIPGQHGWGTGDFVGARYPQLVVQPDVLRRKLERARAGVVVQIEAARRERLLDKDHVVVGEPLEHLAAHFRIHGEGHRVRDALLIGRAKIGNRFDRIVLSVRAVVVPSAAEPESDILTVGAILGVHQLVDERGERVASAARGEDRLPQRHLPRPIVAPGRRRFVVSPRARRPPVVHRRDIGGARPGPAVSVVARVPAGEGARRERRIDVVHEREHHGLVEHLEDPGCKGL